MRTVLVIFLGVIALLVAGVAALARPVTTPVNEHNAAARLTLACRVVATAFRIDDIASVPEGACACYARELGEDIPSERFVREVEELRTFVRRSIFSAWDKDADTRALQSELRRQVMTFAILDRANIERAGRRCESEIVAASSASSK